MIKPMRRESSTVVSLVGEVGSALLAELARSPNVSVVRPPGTNGANGDDLEAAVRALRQATGKASSYVLVPADPLAGVASRWRAMWDLSQGPRGSAGFEARAAEAVAAWRAGRFELPDYYLVLTPAGIDSPGPGTPGASAAAAEGAAAGGPAGEGSGPDLYLGPLRAARPRRVAVVLAPPAEQQGPPRVGPVLDALRGLRHGPWWPPLGELIDTARRFFPGGLAEASGSVAAQPPS
jgi:hypothetical protein